VLAKRIIPTLLKRGDALVKGERFNGWRTVGHVEQAARIHQARVVDELCILDIAATPEGRGPDLKAIERLTADCFMPLTVGGGVRTIEDVDGLLRAGADKVSIHTRACSGVVEEAASRFGSQAVVVAIDLMGECDAGAAVAREMEARGAGEILLTSMAREGTMEGYDLDLIRAVSSAVDIPVVAHGGCSGPADMLAAIRAGASAVAAGALFQFTDHTPRSCAQFLQANGVEVRL
jgi:cyclase